MAVYVIDATNVLRRLQDVRRRSPEEDRLSAEFLETMSWLAARYAPQGHSFRVVFDGAPRVLGAARIDGLDVFFGKEAGADRVVLDQARYLTSSGKKVVVVTADGGLQDLAAEEGAESMLPEEFLRKFRIGR